ncbi:quercetin 2,3-dioxygenase [Rhodocytophaga aerolata]|uniref:Quercetin 2,3-dioxygenase n=1 Tax=Rhodocytophaga aerolata TaxID=455078 RepID=A0ABT8R2F6_9BACT|nr:quercetin 2,3-dioxygenase [Rhodocytophaga aerolata]MDO1445539.1 quercetin 2,3-dioxygenase [Rhodocytophaga aerolata]
METTKPLNPGITGGNAVSENTSASHFTWAEHHAAILEKGAEMPGGVGAMQAVEPTDKLPGQKLPYFIRSGQGERYLAGGLVVNMLARGCDTGDLYEWVVITGGKGAFFPSHVHQVTHEVLFVLEGEVEVWMNNTVYRCIKGDFVSIPPKTTHAFRMATHRTQVLSITNGHRMSDLYRTLGQPYTGYVQPSDAISPLADQNFVPAQQVADIVFGQEPLTGQAQRVTNTELPKAVVPYVLAAGEGDRYIIGDQLFTILSDNTTSDGKLLFVGTEGPAGEMILKHFHQQHSESFFCVDGQMRMWANQSLLEVTPGDFVAIPAGVIHAYQLKSPYTRFVGLLTPGIFEDFFRSATPYADHVYPQVPGPGPNFKRVMQLDLVLVERPPIPPGVPH